MNDVSSKSTASSVDLNAVLNKMALDPFTREGFDCLNANIKTFIEDLVDESNKISRRHGTDTISALHVKKAFEQLATGSGLKNSRHAGTVGGILLGAGLSTVLSMISTNTSTITGVIVATIFSMVGASLVTLHIAKD